MGNIIKLDQHITNMIAAGEVIEKVASVVKELVENSIDAGSTIINVSLTEGGLKEIVVSDNGCGMDSVDARMALEPHATSKIKDANDLFNIHTLGFRGEALPSIVSVSQFKMKTNCEGGKGTMLVLKDGALISQAMIAHPVGTEITVRNLFYNTPARLATLKSESQELAWVTEAISKMALARPKIAFKLTNNGKLILQTFGSNDRLEVISSLYGNDIAKDMISFHNSEGNFKIYGYTSKINQTRSNKNYINIIVNGRAIKNPKLLNAVCEGYKTLLTVGRYPITFLEILVDFALVDVNAHPSKLEVRFSEEDELANLISLTITQALSRTDLTYSPNTNEDEEEDDEELVDEVEDDEASETSDEASLDLDYQESAPLEVNEEEDSAFLEAKLSDEELDNRFLDFDDFNEKEEVSIEVSDSFDLDEEDSKEEPSDIEEQVKEKFEQVDYKFTSSDIDSDIENKNKLPKLFYIGQLFGTYLLCQNEGEFYLIDQHAANERVNYEKILAKLKEDDALNYELLVPISLNFSPTEKILIEEKMAQINKLGIELEDFGGTTFMVRKVPVWIIKGHEEEFVLEIITHIIDDKKKEKYEFLDSIAKSLACKKSVKANDYLSKMEIDYLLEDLEKCEMPFTCPHGRPVIVKFTKYDIEKWFKRVQ